MIRSLILVSILVIIGLSYQCTHHTPNLTSSLSPLETKIYKFLNESKGRQSLGSNYGPEQTRKFQDGFFISKSSYRRSFLALSDTLLEIKIDSTAENNWEKYKDTTLYYHQNDTVFVTKGRFGETHSLFDKKTNKIKLSATYANNKLTINSYKYNPRLEKIENLVRAEFSYDEIEVYEKGKESFLTKGFFDLWKEAINKEEFLSENIFEYDGDVQNEYIVKRNSNKRLISSQRFNENQNIIYRKRYQSGKESDFKETTYFYKDGLLHKSSKKIYENGKIAKIEDLAYNYDAKGLFESYTISTTNPKSEYTHSFNFDFDKDERGITIVKSRYGSNAFASRVFYFDESGRSIGFDSPLQKLSERYIIK